MDATLSANQRVKADAFVRAHEAREILGVSHAEWDRLRSLNLFGMLRLAGGYPRYKRSDIESFLERSAIPASAGA